MNDSPFPTVDGDDDIDIDIYDDDIYDDDDDDDSAIS